MILLKDVPFEGRARFLLDNICGIPDGSEFKKALGDQGGIVGGLEAYHDLLKGIYSDVGSVEGKDDQQKYLGLLASMHLLYAVFAFGELVQEPDQYCVLIDKRVLMEQYKKGSIAKRRRHLEHHGFSIKYLSEEGEVGSLAKASQLSMSYDRHPDLVRATRRFAESIESILDDMRESTYNKLGIFMKGDYDAGILHKPIRRDALDPLRGDILRTVGGYRQQWMDLVDLLWDRCGLVCSGLWWYGGSPSWGVSFSEKGKKPLAIFTLGSSIVFIELTLPVSSAESIIRVRKSYSDTIRERIESFQCVHCPKKCHGQNMAIVDGVPLCSGRAEARRIYATLVTPEDFVSIHRMVSRL